jgi:O-antigen/teichoic acid export membrane protein
LNEPRPADEIAAAAKGGALLFIGRLFTWTIRFGLAVLLARLLGADGYGLYNLALSVATLVSILPPLGLDTALVRYTAAKADQTDWAVIRANVWFVLRMSLAVSVLISVVLVAVAGPIASSIFHEPRLVSLLAISALLVPTMVLNVQLGAALQGAGRIDLAVLAEQFAQPVVRGCLIGALALIGLTVPLALLVWALASYVATALLMLFVERIVKLRQRVAGTRAQAGELLRFSIPVFLSNVIGKVGTSFQTILLGVLTTANAVGIFAVASNVNLIGNLFHASLVSAAMPLFARSQARGDVASLRRLYQATSKWSFGFNLPIFLVLVIFPGQILAIFGPEFATAELPLATLAGANLVNAATGMSGAVLDMTGHTMLKLVNAPIALAVAVGLNFALVPPYGLMGAALAVLASTSVLNLLLLLEVMFLERASPYNLTFLKPIGAGAVAVVAALGASTVGGTASDALRAAVGIPTLLVTYAVVLLLLGLDDADREILSRVRERIRRRRRSRAQTKNSAFDPTRRAGDADPTG